MALRISINAKKIVGPYGGGNQFATTLEKYLTTRGHEVFRTLVPRLDVVLLLSAQRELNITSYDTEAIADYVLLNPMTVVVQRINTCNEQRGTNLGINRAVLLANQLADYTVFVSAFIKMVYQKCGFNDAAPHCVILNGADEEIFNPLGHRGWQGRETLKIVTHHWSTNYMKGFDMYERLDQLLGLAPYRDLFEFTCIGNIPVGVEFTRTRVIAPLYGTELAQALKQHHIYVTAARHEPGGNHYVEALRCGLPVLYLKSGSLPEYCEGYGVEFTLINFEEKLLAMREHCDELQQRALQCTYTGTWMSSQYERLFKELVEARRASPRVRRSWIERVPYAMPSLARKKIQRIQKIVSRWCG